MVREIKQKSLIQKLRQYFKSPFFIPFSLLVLAFLTLPITFLLSKNEQDIRQNAATMVSGNIRVDTDEVSYRNAAQQLVPENFMVFTLIFLGGILVMMVLYIIYKVKRANNY